MFRDLERSGAGFEGVAAHRAFGANLGIDGRTLNGEGMLVSGGYFDVLGVEERGFDGTTLGSRPHVFVPLAADGDMIPGWGGGLDDRRAYFYVFARLRPGSSMEQASAEVDTLYAAIINEVELPLQEAMTEQTLERFKARRIVLEPGRQGHGPRTSS